MKLNLSPQASARRLTVSRTGDALTINGETFDFSGIPDGATLPRDAVACDMLASDVERVDGEIALTLTLPHGPNAPHAVRFPDPIIDPADGPVALPGGRS